MKILYKKQTANEMDILNHLQRCNTLFQPPLNTYVVLEDYSNKLYEKSITYEAWDNELLIGLAAVYNNTIANEVFLTNLSVEKEYHGFGIAKNLMKLLVETAKKEGFDLVKLEVKQNNLKVFDFHSSNGFVKIGANNDCYIMIYEIKP